MVVVVELEGEEFVVGNVVMEYYLIIVGGVVDVFYVEVVLIGE